MTKDNGNLRNASILALIPCMIILVLALLSASYTGFISDRMLSISLFFISSIVVVASALSLLLKKGPTQTFGLLIIFFSALAVLGFGFYPYYDTGLLIVILICAIVGIIAGILAISSSKK